ncbi:MAG: PVC-type heme-binding CxxCH protein, partial [Verrucomicrobiales bacterium]
IELVAAEPEVVDPVAFEWGADGRLWVIEMRDYPSGIDGNGKAGGVVKVLEDQDGDGRYGKATTFLDGLSFPTGIMPWRNGVLISAAPEILFACDTDSDGRADQLEVILRGFVPGNQQHRVNGFEWGLDGWIYAANGDSGGTVFSGKTGQTVEISGRDLRFRPDTGEIEAVSSQSQFGRRRDDFGNWFGNNNPTWLWHVGLPDRYLRRNPKLAIKSAKRVLANYENANAVFPTSEAPMRPNQAWSLNHVTSACSPCPYRDYLFGPEFTSSVFISEPVHNVVHREVLIADGAGLRSGRATGEETSEFLSSSDPWFRPTSLRTGPDGALYIADFYRFVIEHPEWISPEMQARLDLRAGEDRGRIYRVHPTGIKRREVADLSSLDAGELAAALDSPSGWQRDCVQRLIYERGIGAAAEGALSESLGLANPPPVRAQALATLGMIGRLTEQQVVAAMADPHPGVRIQALRQAESLCDSPESEASLLAAVTAATGDSSPAVRMQAAFSIGAFPPQKSEPVIARVIARDGGDEWIRAAAMSSLHHDSPMFASLDKKGTLAAPPPLPSLTPSSPDRAKVIASYDGIGELEADAQRGQELFQSLCATCHRLGGEGTMVGPDLDLVLGKPSEWLLAAILDPGAAVEARFAAWTATLQSGESVVGIITAETANNLTFRLPAGTDIPVLRDDIEKLEAAKIPLMPTGFESALDRQAMADLLAWMRRKR